MPSQNFELVSRKDSKREERSQATPRGIETSRKADINKSFDSDLDGDDDYKDDDENRGDDTVHHEEDEEDEEDAMTTTREEDLNEILQKEHLYPWFNVILIAVVVGTVEYIPLFFLGVSINAKYDFLDSLITTSGLAVMTITNVVFSIICIVTASLTTRLVPCTAGSGVPALTGYLYNGRKSDKDLFTSQMVLIKMIGVELAIVGGLAVGREGPAIHIGAAIGDLTNRFINKTIRVYTGKKVPFSGSVKSNVVMMGATCGFASAFRSPIGGMLYCVEEIATHWDIKSHMSVGAQTFVAAAIAAFTTQTILNLSSASAKISFSSIIIFSEEETNAGTTAAAYEYHDLPGFFLTAICCGLLAGATTRLSNWLRVWKKANTPSAGSMQLITVVGAAVVIAGLTTLCFSLIPLLYTDCHELPGAHHDDGGAPHRLLSGGGGDRTYVQYTCEDGNYSPLASLSLAGEEGVIRHLLSRDDEEFQMVSLLIFLVIYLPISVSNRLLAIPMGSFVPNLLIGGLVGRVIGEAMQAAYPSTVHLSPPGVFALLGAASMLGAWTRTMMAVVVTLIEVTGDVGMVSPLICGVILSRSIANRIADHSYTHELFYDLIDDPDSDGPLILHPNDWQPQKKVVRDGDDSDDHSYLKKKKKKGAGGGNDECREQRKTVTLTTPSVSSSRRRANTTWAGFAAPLRRGSDDHGDQYSASSPARNTFLKSLSSISLDRGSMEQAITDANDNDNDDEDRDQETDSFNTNVDTDRRDGSLRSRASSSRSNSWTVGVYGVSSSTKL